MGQFLIPGLIPANVKAGVNILGVQGASSVVDTSDATAVASQILAGVTAYINGAKTTGTMPNRGAPTITPGTADQTLSAGCYSGGTIKGDPNLVSNNILAGTNIFGVAGSAPRRASGTATATGSNADGYITIRGLAFAPTVVVLTTYNTSYDVGYGANVMVSANKNASNQNMNRICTLSLTRDPNTPASTFTNAVPTWYADGFTVYIYCSAGASVTWKAYE